MKNFKYVLLLSSLGLVASCSSVNMTAETKTPTPNNERKVASAEITNNSAPSEKIPAETRIAPSTGAIFTRDTSNFELGLAFRDPSGIIWGEPLKVNNSQVRLSLVEADQACQQIGARLPSARETKALLLFLGLHSAQGYSPFIANSRTNILPGLTKEHFFSLRKPLFWIAGLNYWSLEMRRPGDMGVSKGTAYMTKVQYFNGKTGEIEEESHPSDVYPSIDRDPDILNFVRCVSQNAP
jgi:hypothetical protein